MLFELLIEVIRHDNEPRLIVGRHTLRPDDVSLPHDSHVVGMKLYRLHVILRLRHALLAEGDHDVWRDVGFTVKWLGSDIVDDHQPSRSTRSPKRKTGWGSVVFRIAVFIWFVISGANVIQFDDNRVKSLVFFLSIRLSAKHFRRIVKVLTAIKP